MRMLSKSKLMAFRQCPKRLWLEVHHPELRQDSSATQASFAVGHQVGDIAQKLYDPEGKGVLIDPQTEGFDAAFLRTKDLLQSNQPIFEAGFCAEGALAFADVMLPVEQDGKRTWRMIEVKSSTSVKDYHRDDAAVQAFLARASGVPLSAIALAHIDSDWVYPGNEDYKGLLKENDLTTDAFGRDSEVRGWITEAQRIVEQKKEPRIATGEHCTKPYKCGFLAHCQSQEPNPIRWLPKPSKELVEEIAEKNIIELRDVPDELLNDKQQGIKAAILSGKPYFDQKGAAQKLAKHTLPAYFMDFETIPVAVPIWKDTRPYKQTPFQFSVHHLSLNGNLEHHEFLDLTGNDPSEAFATALIKACGEEGSIFVYNTGLESPLIRKLSERFRHLEKQLLALNARVVDLLPVARNHYYHPSQKGSWSIKVVLPALCPELSYEKLDGVQDGGMAMEAYLEALSPQTSAARKNEIKQQLLAYCGLDTYAMVRMWAIFTGSALKV